jgi:FKBP-type peptidyl-prolyl cis-trans isomerase FklB
MKASTFIAGIVLAALAGAGAVVLLNKSEAPVGQPAADISAADPASPASEQEVAYIPAREGAYKDDFAALNSQREGVVTLPSGVQYEVLESGHGDQPESSDTVLVRYQASLPDGRVFDTTEDDQEPLVLPLESIAVPGLREALLLMQEGDHWRVVIPPSEGFGRTGNNRLRRRDLIYDIRLVAIDPPV